MSTEADYLILQNHYKNLGELSARLMMIVDLYKGKFGGYLMRLQSLLAEYGKHQVSDLTLEQAHKLLSVTNGHLLEDFQQLHLITENFFDQLEAPYAGIIKALIKSRASHTSDEDLEFLRNLYNAPCIKEMAKQQSQRLKKIDVLEPFGNA